MSGSGAEVILAAPAWRRTVGVVAALTGAAAAVGAGLLLFVELAVQVPFVGLDPLQGVMGTVAVALVCLGLSSARRSGTKDQP